MTGGEIKYDKEELQHSKTGLTKMGVQNPAFVHTLTSGNHVKANEN